MANRRIRVLHLLTAFGYGGAEQWLLKLIQPLGAEGVDVGFVLKAPEMGPLRGAAESRGAPTYEVRLPVTHVGYVRGIAEIVRRERYDVVHTHEFVYSGIGVAAAQLLGKPSVLTFHHYVYDPQTSFTRRFGIRQAREIYGRVSVQYAVRHAALLTAFSRAVFSHAVPPRVETPRRMLRLCVETRPSAGSAERGAFRRALGWEEDAQVIVHAGRFIEQKNHPGLLRIFRRVLHANPSVRLALLGHGPLEGEVREAASDLAASGAVRFLGVRDDLQGILAASDLLLFPSRSEGFGLVALEANAAGIPVIGTSIPGLDEAVIHGETSLLFDVDDESGMAGATVELLADKARAWALGDRGRTRAGMLYSPASSAALLADAYRACA